MNPSFASEPAKPAPTPSDLRVALGALTDDRGVGGRRYGAACSTLIDDALTTALDQRSGKGRFAIVALGSYGRRELCPSSDLDVLLLHAGKGDARATAEALWYPLWNANLVLGHSVATVKEQVRVCEEALDTFTAVLDGRHVAGEQALTSDLLDRAHRLGVTRRGRFLAELTDRAREREQRHGSIAEMLEPNLKEGAGGLRDVHALAWAGWLRGPPGGLGALVASGFVEQDDVDRLSNAHALLLDVRVALHRARRSSSDFLALQDQDAVAVILDKRDADALMHDVAAAGRVIRWITNEAWGRLLSAEQGPGSRLSVADRDLGDGIALRDDHLVVDGDAVVTPLLVLRVALLAASHQRRIQRLSLARLAKMPSPAWTPEETQTFLELLACGREAIPALEALDHVGVLERLLPEWRRVQSLPQRNAYHRFTVDRHLLEAVAECAALLHDDGFDGEVAAQCDAELLPLAALLHDLAKGLPGDHSEAGADLAHTVCERLGLSADRRDAVVWLVRNHLLLAKVATRRDLSDDRTISRVIEQVQTIERLRLLYLLTVGDSRATGPAAWSSTKALLLRTLYVAAARRFGPGDTSDAAREQRRTALGRAIGNDRARAFLAPMPSSYAASFPVDRMVEHAAMFESGETVVELTADGDQLVCTVVAPDRRGILAAGARGLAAAGMDLDNAVGFSSAEGKALEVFTGHDRFERLGTLAERERAADVVRASLEDDPSVQARFEERIRTYRGIASAPARVPQPVGVRFDLDATEHATVVEVGADDEFGLLARLAEVFADLDLDVTFARATTLPQRVLDVFYVTKHGQKLTDPLALDQLKATLVARLATSYTIP